VHGRECLLKQALASVSGVVAIAAAAAILLSGCSPEVGLPAVHDMPPPRAETPLSPDQIKQATDELANERDHLSSAAQVKSQQNPTPGKKAVAEARKKPAPPTAPAGRPLPLQASGADAKP
jgi:hypothetical protein